MSDRPFRERTNDRRVVPWLLVGLVVLFGGLYAAAYLATSDRVPRGTTVSGVQIGGLRPAAARTALAEGLAERRTAPIQVTALERRSRIVPAQAGLDVDVAASVEQAGGGRSWHPARIWEALAGGSEYDAVVTVDEAALRAAVEGFAREVDRPAREGQVVFKGNRAVPRQPADGTVVEVEGALEVVVDAYLLPRTGPVALPTVVDEPEIGREEVSAAMAEFADPATSGPVTMVLAGQRVVLRPRDFLPALTMVPRDGSLEPELDEELLARRVKARMRTVSLAPRDATVRLVDGRPQVVPAHPGVTFAEDELAAGFLDAVVAEGAARTFRLRGVVDRPDFTTREARALGIREVVSSYVTYYPHAEYRNVNQGRAAELVNGTVLKPGDVFSLNEIVGERTAENGFTKGFIISDGVFKEDYGGGVSQVATTLFNAMFFAGLKDVEHKPHSFYIDRYPVGREATVAWPYVDLKFANDTPYGVLVEAWVVPSTPSRPGEMHVRMWSTKYWRIVAGQSARYNFTEEKTRRLSGPDCYPNEGYGGFDIDVYRDFYRPGNPERVRREVFTTTYTPSDRVICTDS